MEFEQCIVRCLESEEEEEKEVLSLRYLVTENAGHSVKWESSSTNHHDTFFEFALSNSTANKSCPAEELFHQDRLLPGQAWMTQSSQQFSCSKSESQHANRRLLHENRRLFHGNRQLLHGNRQLLHEKLDAWRTDSRNTQSGCGSSFISTNSKAFQNRGIRSSSETFLQKSKSTFQPDRTSKPPQLGRKMRLKWLQFFAGGLITTPPINLQGLRLKQGKPKSSNNALENRVFKRSVSSNCEEGLVSWRKEERAVNSQQKSISVGKESIISKGWKIFTPVIKCLSIRERSSEEGIGSSDNILPEVDQSSVGSKNGGARVHPSPPVCPCKRSTWIFPKLLLHLIWPESDGKTF